MTSATAGALSVGVVGLVFLGAVQDHYASAILERDQPALYQEVAIARRGLFGQYNAINSAKVQSLPTDQQKLISDIDAAAKKNALSVVAILPGIMLVCYLLLMVYFRTTGGYKAQVLTTPEQKLG